VTGAAPGPSSIRRPRAKRGEGERLRDEILAAAERLLVKTGDADAVSIRGVAEAVGCTPPSIYLHFADKGELLFSVCQRHFEELNRYTEDASASADDPVDRLRLMGHAYVRFGLENPEAYRVLFLSANKIGVRDFDAEQLMELTCFGKLVATVAACIDAGRIRPGDPFTVACTVWVALHGLVSLLITRPDFPWPDVDLTSELIEMTMHGVLT